MNGVTDVERCEQGKHIIVEPWFNMLLDVLKLRAVIPKGEITQNLAVLGLTVIEDFDIQEMSNVMDPGSFRILRDRFYSCKGMRRYKKR